MTPTGIIQVKQGIGDVIWHLPFIRAIAAAAPGGIVTFLTLPSTHAAELLQAEPCVAGTIYFEHGGSELARGRQLIQLAAILRRCRLHTLWILDRTVRPALAARLAGIPERIGLGLGAQRFLITNPGIDRSHFHDHPIEWLRALMIAMNVPFATTEPELKLPASSLSAIAEKFHGLPRPWIVLGIGASDPSRDWPDGHWARLLDGLRTLTPGTVFVIGGRANMERAQRLTARNGNAPAINACDLTLVEALALLHHANLFVGTDSGPMNLAVAAATPAFALFGVNPVLSYSKFIHAIQPDGGPSPGGMLRISPAHVLQRIAPYLAANAAGA